MNIPSFVGFCALFKDIYEALQHGFYMAGHCYEESGVESTISRESLLRMPPKLKQGHVAERPLALA